MSKLQNPFKNKKFKRGGLSALFTVMFIAAVIMLNIIAKLTLDRFNAKIDLSENRIFSIEESTANYLAQLNDKVNITVMSRENDYVERNLYYNQTNEIIKRFAAASDNVSVKYLDFMSNPKYSANYDNLTESSIIVESENTGRVRVLNNYDYISEKYYDYSGTPISREEFGVYYGYGMAYAETGAGAESALLSAFLSVTDVNPVTVGMATGFGELEALSASSVLEKNGYIVKSVHMETDELNQEIDFLFINSPQADYSIEAVKKLDAWLDNNGNFGKNLIYMASYAVETPNLDSLLESWGISVEKALIFQTNPQYRTSVVIGGYQDYLQHYEAAPTQYAERLNPDYRIFGEYLLYVKPLFETKGNVSVRPLITAYDGAVVYPFEYLDGTIEEEFDTAKAPQGKWEIGVESKRSRYENNGFDEYSSRLIVFGGEPLFSDYFMQMENANNSDFFISMMNKISGKEVAVTLTEKSFSAPAFQINAEEASVIGFIFAVALPVIIVVAGVVIWLKRRYK